MLDFASARSKSNVRKGVFSSFTAVVFTPYYRQDLISVTLKFLSALVFNLVVSKILSFGKENPFLNNKNLDSTKLKVFADGKKNSVFDGLENIVENVKNAG